MADFTPEDRPTATRPTLQSHSAFRRITREITDDELSSPAARKFLLAEVDRLDEENRLLRGYQERFHEIDKRAALLENKIKRSVSGEFVSASGLAVGAAALGYAPAVWSSPPSGWIALAFGSILIVFGIVAKVART